MGNFGIGEMAVIAIFGLLVFGPQRLPEMARSVGGFIREFKSVAGGFTDELKAELDSPAKSPPAKADSPATAAPVQTVPVVELSAESRIDDGGGHQPADLPHDNVMTVA